ncbi:MAG: DNA-processing protein DprA [Steroidobacteraceae bacterium]
MSAEPVVRDDSFRSASPAEFLGMLNDVEERNAPRTLFLQGDESLLRRGPRVSVVGSRKASEEGMRRAQVLVRALVRHDMVVVSGLAEGIDRVAHETAIEAGGRTIAVIGTPLDVSYPKENAALQARIAREHLLVSQFAPGVAVTPKNFPIRNRLMALLTDATVIVEAGEKSGTIHQGWEALRLGRLLFLMESVAMDTSLSWPAEFIRYGAQVLTRSNLDEALDEVPALTAVHSESFSELA